LPVSEIGEIAAFARRRGNIWFLAILNAMTPRNVNIPLTFLDAGQHKAMLVRDKMDDPAAVVVENASFRNRDTVKVDMRLGGGFIARFS